MIGAVNSTVTTKDVSLSIIVNQIEVSMCEPGILISRINKKYYRSYH